MPTGRPSNSEYDAAKQDAVDDDQLGCTTVETLDAGANVIYEQDPKAAFRLREYDARDNLLRRRSWWAGSIRRPTEKRTT